jgi:predicted outer membrane repeat protein
VEVFRQSHHPTLNLYRSDFIGNSSINGGGVHILEGSNPSTIINCSFRGNSVANLGGGICSHRENELRNCLFSGNYSAFQGGAIHFASGINYEVNNCTIAANKSVNAGSAILVTSGILNIRNSVIDINNGPFTIGAPTVNATYSLIQGGMVGYRQHCYTCCIYEWHPGISSTFFIRRLQVAKMQSGH